MCGIAGVLSRKSLDWDECAHGMASALVHRGPDDSGIWVDANAGVALGHQRLAILDLSPNGAQPMVSRTGRFVIVYNGEVYNCSELRSDLGHATGRRIEYRGHSDTEVLLTAIETWGLQAATSRLVGMFAFALWDRQAGTLHLVRDRIGEKPLYYGCSGGTFAFASELKALGRVPGWQFAIDRTALDLLLRYEYVPAPHSIYQGIQKLLPGTILSVRARDLSNVPEPEAYWSAREVFEHGAAAQFTGSDQEAVQGLESVLRRAVRGQMVADVPLGAFLSGGLDSSTVVALMQAESSRPVRTFTIGFTEAGFDEAAQAGKVAAHLGTEHTELYVTGEDALAMVPTLAAIYDEPFADASQIPTCVLARMARGHVTVSLSGDGGDELFGGYHRYRSALGLYRVNRSVPRVLRHLAGQALDAAASPALWNALGARGRGEGPRDPLLRYRLANLARRIAAPSREAMYHAVMSRWKDRGSPVRAHSGVVPMMTAPSRSARLEEIGDLMMHQDLLSYLPDDILVKVDRATMGVSLESRAPYLDHRVVEFAGHLPIRLKVRDGAGKWILRQVLHRFVPPALVDRPKHGFGPPIRDWLRGPLREWAEDLLAEGSLKRQGFLDPALLRRLWSDHQHGSNHWTSLLWSTLMFQAWLEQEPFRVGPASAGPRATPAGRSA